MSFAQENDDLMAAMLGNLNAPSVKKFDDDEARDDHGRWTSGGGNSGKKDKPGRPKGRGPSQTQENGTFVTNSNKTVEMLELKSGGNLNTNALRDNVFETFNDGVLRTTWTEDGTLHFPNAGLSEADHGNFVFDITPGENPDLSQVRGILDTKSAQMTLYDLRSEAAPIASGAHLTTEAVANRLDHLLKEAQRSTYYVNGKRVKFDLEDINSVMGFTKGTGLDADNTPGQRKYGSVHWLAPVGSGIYDLQNLIGSMIPDNKLASWGREDSPHITFRYGLLDDNYSALVLFLQGLRPFEAQLGSLISFPPSEHSDGAAPIVFKIETPNLQTIHELLLQVGNWNPTGFDSYKPHLSVAYVKAEDADSVVAELAPLVKMLFQGKPFVIDHAVIRLGGGNDKTIRVDFESGNVTSVVQTEKAPLEKAKKKKIVGDPDKKTKIKRRAIKDITDAVAMSFEETVAYLREQAEKWLKEGATADEIAEQMSQSAFDTYVPSAVAEALAPVLAEAAAHQFTELNISDDAMFDLINSDALEYAQQRGAELVGRKWSGGRLVDNPDARWAITPTTREGLRNLVSQSYEDGWTPKQLADEIENSYTFSRDRAEMIANTEAKMASSQGILAGWSRSGMVSGKSWNLSDDHDEEDECDDNEDDGVIDIDDVFSSGDHGPPAHPNCKCSLTAELIPE